MNVSSSENKVVRNNSKLMWTTFSDFQRSTQDMAWPEPWAATIAFSWYEGLFLSSWVKVKTLQGKWHWDQWTYQV